MRHAKTNPSPPAPRPTEADTADADYLFRPDRERQHSQAEERVLIALAKLGTSDEVIDSIVSRQVINPATVLRLAGLPPLDLRTDRGQYLVSLYERRRGSLR